jgi:hypothetical protein
MSRTCPESGVREALVADGSKSGVGAALDVHNDGSDTMKATATNTCQRVSFAPCNCAHDVTLLPGICKIYHHAKRSVPVTQLTARISHAHIAPTNAHDSQVGDQSCVVGVELSGGPNGTSLLLLNMCGDAVTVTLPPGESCLLGKHHSGCMHVFLDYPICAMAVQLYGRTCRFTSCLCAHTHTHRHMRARAFTHCAPSQAPRLAVSCWRTTITAGLTTPAGPSRTTSGHFTRHHGPTARCAYVR